MSTSNAIISIFIWAHLSPLVFLLHLFYLGLFAYWKEQPFALMLHDVVVSEDDMDIPHPPGYFNPLGSSQGTLQELTLDDSLSTSGDVSSADDTLLSTTGDTSGDISIAVLMSNEVDPHSGLVISTSLREMPAPDSAKEILTSGSSYAVSAAILSSDLELSGPALIFGLCEAPFSDCYEDTLHLGGKQLQPPLVPDNIRLLQSLDSVASLDITEQHSNSSSSSDSDCYPSPPPTPTTPTSSEFVELDMTEEGESIIKNLHIHPISVFARSKDPNDRDTRPVFSRHNINDKVVFPVRKLSSSSSSGSAHQRSFSENVNLALGHISASLNMAKEENKKRNNNNRMSTILLTSLFTSVGEDVQARSLPEKDQYDSWPWIRDAIEHDVAQEEKESNLPL
ncbi:hypothetical protein M378DRAFT_738810 [Amanita muscaria Koide BX008]|uniref:Uncharacterized protein n=1 Tax=Amanita muscaria (strain Koide BX008) TaxID=946122 RepID=A0A0C2X2E2_AMAMK|nr:hypothetical protein M378DRAFT_738810 [Amanita muscaria Koide BX008]